MLFFRYLSSFCNGAMSRLALKILGQSGKGRTLVSHASGNDFPLDRDILVPIEGRYVGNTLDRD